MVRLSSSIFEWDEVDYSKLMLAKKGELKLAGLKSPTDDAIRKAISKNELAIHCKHQTKGTSPTIKSIEELILAFTGCTDTLGVPMLNDRLVSIWLEQKRHVKCFQDPIYLSLYYKTGEVVKGGVTLPVYRCARGSTSLESFHHHLLSFIPGTSANAVNFQAYLLDGLSRWNALRKDVVNKSDVLILFESIHHKYPTKFSLPNFKQPKTNSQFQ